MTLFRHKSPGDIPDVLKSKLNKYIPVGNAPGGNIEISEMLKASFYYFSLEASLEVKHFLGKGRYRNLAVEIDNVLYFSGRILPDQQFGGYPQLCDAALDLCRSSFCVPLMDQYSPVALSIALEIHDVRHRGVAAIFRQMLKVAYILGGFSLATTIKQGCKRCRILNKIARSIQLVHSSFIQVPTKGPLSKCGLLSFGPPGGEGPIRCPLYVSMYVCM